MRPDPLTAQGNEFGYSAVRRSLLLGAFFPGYLLTQLPAGWAAQVWGPKKVI